MYLLNRISRLLIFITAECNLRCSYCYINKTARISEVDDKLAKALKDDYYINFLKDVISESNLANIKRIELWGGEPSIHLDRAYNFLETAINVLPNFEVLHFSTNCTSPKLKEGLKEIIRIFSKHPERKFEISLQISIDGPSNITDESRGAGTTQRIADLYHDLIDCKFNLGNAFNVTITPKCKATCDIAFLSNFLYDDFIYEYYSFFESNFVDSFINKKDARINISRTLPIPNFPSPYSYTQADGMLFGSVCEHIRKNHSAILSKLNHYKNIMFLRRDINEYMLNSIKNLDYKYTINNCFPTVMSIGLLPDYKLTGCVREFSEYIELTEYENTQLLDFKKSKDNNILFKNKDRFYQFNNITKNLYNIDGNSEYHNPLLVSATNLTRYLARCGLIDPIYIDEKEAYRGALIGLTSYSVCVNNYMAITGSIVTPYTGILKFMLNGALEYIYPDFRKLGE